MEIHLKSTTLITAVNGIRGRIWEGVTARGAKVHAIIPIIAVDQEQDHEEFERELQEVPPAPPSAKLLRDYQAIDARLIT